MESKLEVRKATTGQQRYFQSFTFEENYKHLKQFYL